MERVYSEGTLSLSGRITVHTDRRPVAKTKRLRGATLHLPRLTFHSVRPFRCIAGRNNQKILKRSPKVFSIATVVVCRFRARDRARVDGPNKGPILFISGNEFQKKFQRFTPLILPSHLCASAIFDAESRIYNAVVWMDPSLLLDAADSHLCLLLRRHRLLHR